MKTQFTTLGQAKQNKELLPPCGHCGHQRYNKCGCKKTRTPGSRCFDK